MIQNALHLIQNALHLFFKHYHSHKLKAIILILSIRYFIITVISAANKSDLQMLFK